MCDTIIALPGVVSFNKKIPLSSVRAFSLALPVTVIDAPSSGCLLKASTTIPCIIVWDWANDEKENKKIIVVNI